MQARTSRRIQPGWGAARTHPPYAAALTLVAGPARDWGAQLNTTVVIESIIAWLDAGQPDPDEAAERIALTVTGIERAVRRPEPRG